MKHAVQTILFGEKGLKLLLQTVFFHDAKI